METEKHDKLIKKFGFLSKVGTPIWQFSTYSLTVSSIFLAKVDSAMLANGLSAPQHSTYFVILLEGLALDGGPLGVAIPWTALSPMLLFRSAFFGLAFKFPFCCSCSGFWNSEDYKRDVGHECIFRASSRTLKETEDPVNGAHLNTDLVLRNGTRNNIFDILAFE